MAFGTPPPNFVMGAGAYFGWVEFTIFIQVPLRNKMRNFGDAGLKLFSEHLGHFLQSSLRWLKIDKYDQISSCS